MFVYMKDYMYDFSLLGLTFGLVSSFSSQKVARSPCEFAVNYLGKI